jgi:hypothetical protein
MRILWRRGRCDRVITVSDNITARLVNNGLTPRAVNNLAHENLVFGRV